MQTRLQQSGDCPLICYQNHRLTRQLAIEEGHLLRPFAEDRDVRIMDPYLASAWTVLSCKAYIRSLFFLSFF
jgi:hypothetical protein